MNKKWEIRRVSTPERIFDKIKEEMAQPVGVVLFGVDGDFKKEVLHLMMDHLRGFAYYFDGAPDTKALVDATRNFQAVAVTLSGAESSTEGLRYELAKVMQAAGVKTVVGIYAKVEKVPIRPLMSNVEKLEFNKQITAIEAQNADDDWLDYSVTAEEGEDTDCKGLDCFAIPEEEEG